MVDMFGLIQEFFVDPIVNYSGYNFVNTLVYGAIMLALAFFVIYPQLSKRGVKFDINFMVSLLPYVLIGIGLRVIEDMRLIGRSANPLELGYYFISPGIWLLIGGVAIAGLLISKCVAKKKGWNFYKVFGGVGVGIAVPFLVFDFLNFVAWYEFVLIGVITAVVTGAVYFIIERVKKGFFKNDMLNVLAVGSQALDGSATFVATQILSCGEQHPLSEMILDVHGFAFIVVKVLLVLVIVYYIDREIQEENLRGFAKVFIIILGSATGLRDIMTVGVGTCL